MHNQQGFTLIELMIVVAISAILSMIAIPAYLNYTIKARVTEGLNLASTAQIAVEEVTIFNNALPASQAATQYISPTATANVSSIIIGANGVIVVTYTALAGGGMGANTLVLTPNYNTNSSITWTCTGTLAAKYLPVNCR